LAIVCEVIGGKMVKNEWIVNRNVRRKVLGKVVFLCIFCLLLSCDFSNAESIESVHVQKIIDGDSIVVTYGAENITVRLWGIDTPEYRQSYSKEAKKYTTQLLANSKVALEVKDWDEYGRMVALVKMQDGKYANEELIRAGYAWVHIYYCKEPICEKWKRFEKNAQKKSLGLWREKKPVAPWIWKRKHRK
jgi:endonuclease YncB( thermonuclease family)